MYDTIDQLEAGIAAYRKMKRRRLNRNLLDQQNGDGGDSGIDDAHNLAHDVPDDAWELWQEMPADPRDESYRDTLGESVKLIQASDYDKSLGEIIEDEVNGNAIIDLGSGTYQLDREYAFGPDIPGDIFGVIGDGASQTTIKWRKPSSEQYSREDYLFNHQNGTTLTKGYLYGVTVDIDEPDSAEYIADVGIIRARVTDEFWADDVVLKGQRKRWQYIDGELKEIGGYNTWTVEAVTDNSTVFQHRVKLDDGLIFEPDHPAENHMRQGIAYTVGPAHVGTSVFKECSVSDWSNNGFYFVTDNSHLSRNILWDCKAKNCGAGAMRISENDEIIGGKSVRHDPPGYISSGDPLPSQMLQIQAGQNTKVIGLRIESSNYGRSCIWVRKDSRDEIVLDRVMCITSGDSSRPARLVNGSGGTASVTLKDCYWYDEFSGSRYQVHIDNATVTAEGDTRITSEGNNEINVGSNGSFFFDGTTYREGTYTRSQLGMDTVSPEDFPEYDFDYSVRN